ncbi:MAG: acyl-CoA dehydrogenase family protein [Desulfobacterales bacterium]|jgi:alkylation response protein AidB-like acyl-CoA dehydrogenase|nr:acyl-CoA dehydrogenase [Desulfobacter sp.]MDP6395070.1 acyl-CoA dehydrogenase family protein [Desulfobacterales bacterium]MDP6683125.1 acyl-CoA dehydrogenase family protein [Desulfobacterales bacterium]MDP6806454.1 acyl-CoA dehydrogenase family protein [Desulfobacterales bacterium]|tara:strand:- start:86959 stop:88107 length:1149 start_codon:yes stop_codon:yes gene_type:complete
MDFALTEEQLMVKDMARRLAETEIKPVAAELDENHEHPAEIVKKMGELKLMGIAVPEEYGGGGMDNVSYVLALIEISKACASTGAIMSVNNSLYCYPVMAYGTHEQKMKYLPPVAGGEKTGCYALTEAGAGSDPSGLLTSAIQDGDEWIINGEKKFITSGNVASYAVVAALTEKGKGYKGISSFVMDLEKTPGFKVGRVEEKLGINASGTAELIFENARVPVDGLLGNKSEGFKQMLTTLDGGRVGIASQAVGIGRAVLDEALEYAKVREQFGKPITSFQAIQWKLADMATELDAAELMTLRAAWLEDNGKPYEKAAAMAKMYASDVTMRAAVEGVQILGGYGYCKEYPMERHMRDAKICQIYEGTNEIMRLVIANNLIKGK